jgi:LCP family protein required for cell wall assembly
MLKRTFILSSIIITCLVLLVALIAALFGYKYFTRFATAAQIPPSQLLATTKTAYSAAPGIRDRRVNILLAGLDHRNDALEKTLLTDSLIFASFIPRTANVTLIPIPRDLWIPQAKAKINSLYLYGRNAGVGTALLIDSVATLSGQTIDHYLIIDYQLLPQLIDLLGGVDVIVDNSFTDPQFPNPAYITDPTQPVYQTVSFTAGPVHMDGITAVNFMRSRNSPDPAEGSDTARSTRQLKIISTLANRISQPELLSRPEKLGQIMHYFLTTFETDLKLNDLMILAFATLPRTQFQLTTVHIPTSADSDTPILVNPPITKYGQWVFETPSAGLSELTAFFQTQLP